MRISLFAALAWHSSPFALTFLGNPRRQLPLLLRNNLAPRSLPRIRLRPRNLPRIRNKKKENSDSWRIVDDATILRNPSRPAK